MFIYFPNLHPVQVRLVEHRAVKVVPHLDGVGLPRDLKELRLGGEAVQDDAGDGGALARAVGGAPGGLRANEA